MTLRRQGLFQLTAIAHHEGTSGQEFKTATWRQQELQQRPWWNTVYWLAPHACFLSLLPEAVQNHLSWTGPAHTLGCAFPQQPLIKKMSHRLPKAPVLWRHLITMAFSPHRSLPWVKMTKPIRTHIHYFPNLRQWVDILPSPYSEEHFKLWHIGGGRVVFKVECSDV